MIADITKYLFFNAKLPPTHVYYFSISMGKIPSMPTTIILHNDDTPPLNIDIN